MVVRETPGQGCQSGSKSSLEILRANMMKYLRFVWITVSDSRKQTGPPDAGNNLRKSHSSCVTWQNTPRFVEYFSSLGQGFSDRHYERGEGPGDEVGNWMVFKAGFRYPRMLMLCFHCFQKISEPTLPGVFDCKQFALRLSHKIGYFYTSRSKYQGNNITSAEIISSFPYRKRDTFACLPRG